jgi:hypothetical protein
MKITKGHIIIANICTVDQTGLSISECAGSVADPKTILKLQVKKSQISCRLKVY